MVRAGAADAAQAASRPTLDRRSEILAAAAEVFARQGYANATVRDIGESVGILSGSLYHHFTSKEAMLEEIAVAAFDTLIERYQVVIKAYTDPSECFRELIATGLQFMVEQSAVAAVLQNDYHELRTVSRSAEIEDKNRTIRELWLECLNKGVKKRIFRQDLDLQLLYRAVMGTVLSVVRWFDPKGSTSVQQVIELLASSYLDGIRRRK